MRLEASYGSYTRNFTSHTFAVSSSTTSSTATAMCGQTLACCFILSKRQRVSEFYLTHSLTHSLYIGFIISLVFVKTLVCPGTWRQSSVKSPRHSSPRPWLLAAGPGTVTPLAPALVLWCGRCWQPGPSLRWPASRHGETVNTGPSDRNF